MSDDGGGVISILLVEDEPANRALMRAMITRIQVEPGRRFELREAATIADARAILKSTPVAIILLDVRLPDGNGLDLAAELLEAGGSDRPTVIVTSASVLPAERSAALDRGADAFLGKPFGVDDLAAVLRRYALRGTSGR
jgi:CheY-like chemotaxis protein